MAERFENNVFGMVAPEDWLQVGYDVERPNDPTSELWGDVRTDNLVAYWESIAAEYGVPVMAQFHAFGTKAQKALRVPIDVHNIEKGLIKEKIDQSERLRALMARGVQNENELYQRVLRDGYNLADHVFTRAIVAKNEVMYSGKVTIKENNLDLTVDYGVPSAQLALTLDFGNGATAPVDEQLMQITSDASDKGVPIDTLYTTSTDFNRFRKNAAIQLAINGTYGSGALVRVADLRQYMQEEFGINRIILQDGVYSKPYTQGANGRPVTTSNKLFPIGKYAFAHTGGGKIGDGLWGDPPEVSAARYMDVAASEVSPYVYISQYAENDPAVTWTKASALFMPVLYNPNALFVASYTSTTGG
jgi:hypothetical protein